MEACEAELALELAHGYLKPIEVDTEVGLLAVVGEGMQGTPGLAGRIFTAISRESVNIIAIAQGSSELTIAIVVRRDGPGEGGAGGPRGVRACETGESGGSRGLMGAPLKSRCGSGRRFERPPKAESLPHFAAFSSLAASGVIY